MMTARRGRLLTAAALAVLCGPRAPLPAQTTPAFPAREAEALRHKQRGDPRAAGAAFLQLLRETRGDARSAALAQYYAVMAFHMARQSGAWSELVAALDEVRVGTLGRAHPWLADRLAVLGLQAAVAGGNLESTHTRTEALGFVHAWRVIGPFDNERGGGFAVEYGPEKEIALDASYDGKKREVRWRTLPIDFVPAGRIDLDAVVRPNDQVLCYAATCLESDRDRQVLLHLGSDEAFAVFLNGSEVAARDVRRRFAYDQDVISLSLREGNNLLLLKICDQEGGFAFAARLTDPTGAPLDGVRARADDDGLVSAAATEPSPSSSPPPAVGARAVFARSVDTTSDPADAFRLGYLLATSQPDDETDRRDHRYATIAVEGMPDEPAARYLLALTRVQRDAKAEERDDNARRHDYMAILERDPDHAQALLQLAELDMANTGAATTAERSLRRALDANPRFAAARLALARVLRELDLDELAGAQIEAAARTASDEPASPAALRELGRLRERRGELPTAIEAYRAALERGFDAALLPRVADVMMRAGERDAAVGLLRRGIAMMPFDRRPRFRLAGLLEAEGDLEAARAVIGDWLLLCPEDDEAMVRMARLSGLAEDRDQQREWLRSALELNPNLKNESRHLEFLQADEKPFYSGFELNGDEILAADPGPPADAEEQNDAFYYLLHQRVVRAYRNGTTSEYLHSIRRVLNEEGARRLGTYVVYHFYGEQRARLLDARVVKKDGRVQRPRIRGFYVEFPSLEVGDAVEVRSRIDDIRPSYFGDYFGLVHNFVPDDGSPTQRSLLVVILEPGRDYEIQAVNGAPEARRNRDAEGNTVASFEMTGLPRTLVEERRPSWTETEPLVRITTYRDWDHFSTWWWNLIRKQAEVSPAMRAKVDELTSGLTSEADKIAAIYDFVTTDIRYTAWEFGVHGYKPYSTPVIFERRHGDCKDKALLLGSMLSVIGVEAYPVLIHAEMPRSRDDLSLAMVQHFNHCISYLPPTEDRPGMFLDGTATYHPADTLPEMDQGASVLVVKEGRGALRDIDWTTPQANRDERELAISLTAEGNADVVLVQRPSGNAAVALREMLANEPAKRKEKLERRLGRSFGKVDVRDIECSDVLDLQEPVELRVAFHATEFAARQDDGLVLKSAIEARELMPLARAEERELPLLLGAPESEVTLLRYRLPNGYAPVRLPENESIQSPFGSYSQEWEFADGELRIARERSLTRHRIEPADYPEFREFVIAVDQADRRVAIIRKEGQR